MNTAIRGSDQKLKYSPVVDEKSISTTPSSAPVRRDERSAAHPTVSPHYSSTISYQFTTTDGLGYVHVEIGKGATTSRPISLFPSPLPNPAPIIHHYSTPPPKLQLKTPKYDPTPAPPPTVTVKSMPAYPPPQSDAYAPSKPPYIQPKPTYSPLKPSYVETKPRLSYKPTTPKPAYVPPMPTYAPQTRPDYHSPKPDYGLPKPEYHSPKPEYHSPKPVYAPPKPTYDPMPAAVTV